MEIARYVIKISIVAYAQATPYPPFSANSFIRTVIRRYLGVTRRITADIAVIERTKVVTKPEIKESRISGRVTVAKTFPLSAPIS